MEKPKMLLVGDYPVETGFGVVLNALIKEWEHKYDIHVLCVNWEGNYHSKTNKYKCWPASTAGQDVYGLQKFPQLLASIQPAVCFILNDTWVAREYTQAIQHYRQQYGTQTKFVWYGPIDAENTQAAFLQPLRVFDILVTYTEFARKQFQLVGMDAYVLPHGIDTKAYKPVARNLARQALNLPDDQYIVLTVARNQPRKRLDLTFYYFAEWVKQFKLPDTVKLYYHGALQDLGWNLLQLAEYFEIKDRLILSHPDMTPSNLLPLDHMQKMYNSADLFFTTTQSEGFGLPIAEAMASKIPTLIPQHTALADWCQGGTMYMDCDNINVPTMGLNTIHHTVSKQDAIAKLHQLYSDSTLRAQIAQQGYDLITQEKFQWKVIGRSFLDLMKEPHGKQSTPTTVDYD